MDEREAVGLGRELGLRLPAETANRLRQETEGWPALLALAMLGARKSSQERACDRIDAATDDLVAELPAVRGARAPHPRPRSLS